MSPRLPLQPASLRWQTRKATGQIDSGTVDIWAWTFRHAAAPAEADLAILSEEERRRTARFHFAPDQVRYSVCHANMRRLLASYLSRRPESLVFTEDMGGKPRLFLDANDLPLRFNLSHSKNIALLAVTLSQEIGVDVENVRPIERDVAERFFSPAELSAMAGLRGEEWLAAFYRCWTRKEAILKVEGLGLRIPLDSFDVSVTVDRPPMLLASRAEAKLTADWRLHHLDPAEGAMGAVALASAAVHIIPGVFDPEEREDAISQEALP